MSAYIVDDRTINTVVSWLQDEVYGVNGYYLGKRLSDLGYTQEADVWVKKLALDMFKLNIDAVNSRYGHGEAEKFRPLDFVYDPDYTLSTIQVFKSLQCWLYQCSEGKIPETKLYKFFDEVVVKHLLKVIVYSLPEYNQCKWG